MSEQESKVTEQVADNSIKGLLGDFGAPATFEINLPGPRKWTVRGFKTYAEQRRYNEAKASWVDGEILKCNNARRTGDLGPLGGARDLIEIMDRENLEAAYDLSYRLLDPRFEPYEALKLTQAPQLVAKFVDELTYGTAHFLLKARNEAYLELGKGSSGTS